MGRAPRLAVVGGILAALALAGGGIPARAQSDPTTAVVRPDHQAEDVNRLLDTARERGQSVVIRLEPAGGAVKPAGKSAPASAQAGADRRAALEASLLDDWHAAVVTFGLGLEKGVEGVGALSTAADGFARRWHAARNATSSLDALVRLAAVLLGAVAVGWLVRRGIAMVLPRAVPPPEAFGDRLRDSLRAGFADAGFLAAFWLGAHALTSYLLPEPDLLEIIARDLAGTVVAAGYYWLGARVLVSPDRPEARLLPIHRPLWHYRMVLLYTVLIGVTYVTVTVIAEIADAASIKGWYLIASTATLVFKLGWFWAARGDFATLIREGGGEPPSFRARAAAWSITGLLIGVAVLNWVAGRFAAALSEGISWGVAAGVTQVAVAVLPIVAAGADRLTAEALGTDDAAAAPLRKATVAVARALMRGLVWIVGLVLLARLWSVDLSPDGPAQAAWRVAITIGIALVIGWTLLRFASVYLAAHAPKPVAVLPSGDDDEEEPPTQSRLATALPLVRAMIFGVIVGVTALIVLSTLGIDIGPLLAGFGVIGLAISFGSQALVRDIVSGIFFMADDAFRVGEYVDTGRLKGTVEKISLRSLQLRHQSGLVHTIPFGQIQSVTNASRDWSTVKFNIRLERGIDLEKTRKIIKKTGQAMLEDPELAAEIMLPLKLQGVADITEGAVVCRLKITAKPARASWIQREALKRTYHALEEGGIAFASGAVTVRGPSEGDSSIPAPAAGAGAVVALRPPG
jgi:small-conductance mechanosensitive channel